MAAPPDPPAARTGAEAPLQRGWEALTSRLSDAAGPLGIATVIAILAALGIQGDLLSRLLRNSPAGITVALILAVTGGLGLIASTANRARLATLAGFALITAAIIAIWVGVQSVGDREQPDVEVNALTHDTETGTLTFKANATGLSLATKDHMLLRVVGIKQSATAEGKERAAWNACRNTYNGGLDPIDNGELLYWGESAPSLTGTTDASAVLTVNDGDFEYVCAVAVLSGDEKVANGEERSSTVMVSLNRLGLGAS